MLYCKELKYKRETMKTVKTALTTIILTIVIAFMFGCQEQQIKPDQPTDAVKIEPAKPKPPKRPAKVKKTKAPPIKQRIVGTAKIEVKKPVHDFGKIAPKKPKTASMRAIKRSSQKIKKLTRKEQDWKRIKKGFWKR